MALRFSREDESKVHEELYNNIYLLTFDYPTTKDFDSIFRKDMFIKSNKAAFHHVVHYLLNVLNPSVVKQKLPSWPPYDMKMESQLRAEIMRYLNELNSIYEDADLPTVLTSHLISPGGYKFGVFILKLSQLVLFEHLKKHIDPIDLILPIKPLKNNEDTIKMMERLSLQTNEINKQTAELKSNYLTDLESYKVEAEHISNQLSKINNLLPELKSKLNLIGGHQLDLNEINTAFEEIEVKLAKILIIKDKSTEAVDSMTYLFGEDCRLEYQVGDFTIPNEITHVVNPNSTALDLLKLLEGFLIYIDKKVFEITPITTEDADKAIEKFTEEHEELLALHHQVGFMKEKFNLLLTSLKIKSERVNKIGNGAEVATKVNESAKQKVATNPQLNDQFENSDGILAVPLSDSLSILEDFLKI